MGAADLSEPGRGLNPHLVYRVAQRVHQQRFALLVAYLGERGGGVEAPQRIARYGQFGVEVFP